MMAYALLQFREKRGKPSGGCLYLEQTSSALSIYVVTHLYQDHQASLGSWGIPLIYLIFTLEPLLYII